MRSWHSLFFLTIALVGCRKGPEGPAGPPGPNFTTPQEGYIRGTARITDTTGGQNRRVTLSYNHVYLPPDHQLPGTYSGYAPNLIQVLIERNNDPLDELQGSSIRLYADTSQPASSPQYLNRVEIDLSLVTPEAGGILKGFLYRQSFQTSNSADTLLVRQFSLTPNQVSGRFTILRRDVTPHDTIEMEFQSRLLQEIRYQRQSR